VWLYEGKDTLLAIIRYVKITTEKKSVKDLESFGLKKIQLHSVRRRSRGKFILEEGR